MGKENSGEAYLPDEKFQKSSQRYVPWWNPIKNLIWPVCWLWVLAI